MSAWLGGFEGGLARAVPATGIEGFKAWLDKQPLFPGLRLIALHNSDAPDIAQTEATPGGFDARQRNIAPGYKQKGWRGGPTFNVYPDGTIRGGTPWGKYGVHSPSWNDYGIGIEMMASFKAGHDDDDFGKGLVEKNAACEMIAAILRHQHLPVSTAVVKLHKQDPATTHPCPGPDIEYDDVMRRVQIAYDAMGTPGEHIQEPVGNTPIEKTEGAAPVGKALVGKIMVVTTDGLKLRDRGGMNGRVLASLAKGQAVKVWSTSRNASTTWAHVTGQRSGEVAYFDGNVALAYLKAPEGPSLPTGPIQLPTNPIPVTLPGPTPAPTPKPPVVVIPMPTDNPHWGMNILIHEGGLAAFRAAAIVGNWQVESYKDLRPWVKGDFINGVYTAFGIAQWRNERKAALDAYAAGRSKSWDDFETQVLYGLIELSTGLEHASGALLMKATNLEQAVAAAVSAERPAGWHWPADRTDIAAVLVAARKVSHWDWRLRYATERLASI